jgi:uncharacterized protein (DUF4415 family)
MSKIVRVSADTPLTDEERAELRALAQMPDSEIDFSDIPERFTSPTPTGDLQLEEHTVTLRIDAEVAAWLDKSAVDDANRLNWVLKREARRNRYATPIAATELEKAS